MVAPKPQKTHQFHMTKSISAYPAFRRLGCFRHGISASILTQPQKLGLQLKCDLDNVTNLRASGDDFRWYVQAKCTNCGQEFPDFIYVCPAERVALKDSRGDANLIIRCKFCNRVGNVDIVSGSDAAYNAEDSGQFKTILVFECRGVELIAFSPRVGWSANGLDSGTSFVDISLSDKNWCDYDDKGDCEVNIFNVESRFVKLK
ncbi:hypothetical protein CRM22_006191 [Opisthorchis felineus]|uniref:Uncharacterized protein n=1 Tax=Opisthorchis felineus TaxID=147828 RepID=A0A4S2LMC9_OPIFE|nr:hypothetical protein CRM22_006191 [Opisthorchis felineus]